LTTNRRRAGLMPVILPSWLNSHDILDFWDPCYPLLPKQSGFRVQCHLASPGLRKNRLGTNFS
jgi:hypothetical protein